MGTKPFLFCSGLTTTRQHTLTPKSARLLWTRCRPLAPPLRSSMCSFTAVSASGLCVNTDAARRYELQSTSVSWLLALPQSVCQHAVHEAPSSLCGGALCG